MLFAKESKGNDISPHDFPGDQDSPGKLYSRKTMMFLSESPVYVSFVGLKVKNNPHHQGNLFYVVLEPFPSC